MWLGMLYWYYYWLYFEGFELVMGWGLVGRILLGYVQFVLISVGVLCCILEVGYVCCFLGGGCCWRYLLRWSYHGELCVGAFGWLGVGCDKY